MITKPMLAIKPQVIQWAPTMPTQQPSPPGLIWTTAPFNKTLKRSGLASVELPPILDRGMKFYPYQLTPGQIRQAAAELSKGRTVMGPLSKLEKAKQLSVPASEIRQQAKRVEALLGTAEGMAMGWEALAKAQPCFDDAAGIAGGVVATLDTVRRLTSPEPADSVESFLGYTVNALLLLNAVAPLFPHGEQVKRAAAVLGLVVKGTHKTYTSWNKPVPPTKP